MSGLLAAQGGTGTVTLNSALPGLGPRSRHGSSMIPAQGEKPPGSWLPAVHASRAQRRRHVERTHTQRWSEERAAECPAPAPPPHPEGLPPGTSSRCFRDCTFPELLCPAVQGGSEAVLFFPRLR